MVIRKDEKDQRWWILVDPYTYDSNTVSFYRNRNKEKVIRYSKYRHRWEFNSPADAAEFVAKHREDVIIEEPLATELANMEGEHS